MRNSAATIEHMKLVVTKMDGDEDIPRLNLNDIAKNKDVFSLVTTVNPRRNPVLAQTSRPLRAGMTRTTRYPFFCIPRAHAQQTTE